MKTHIYVMMMFLLVPSLSSCGEKPKFRLTIDIKDDAGLAVPGALMETNIFDYWKSGEGFGRDIFKKIQIVADSDGSLALEDSTARCEMVLSAGKQSYYRGGASFKSSTKRNGRWEPWNPTVKITLNRILSPIPLKAKWVQRHMVDPAPIPGNPASYDFEVGDWVAPHGKGKVADLTFRLDGMVKDLSAMYDARLSVSFSHPADGLIEHKPKPNEFSQMRMPHRAPVDGYQPEKVWRKARISQKNHAEHIEHINEGQETDCYFLRLRTVVDEKGNILYAHYAKVMGGFIWYPSAKIRFQYHYNPTPNDRNLEFDPNRNLFTIPKEQTKPTFP